MALTKDQIIAQLTELRNQAAEKANINTYQHGRRVAFDIALELIQRLKEAREGENAAD